MIPFDLETWKANPDAEVYSVEYQIYDGVYFDNAKFDWNFAGIIEGGELDLFNTKNLMLKLPENKPRPNADVIHAYANGLDVYYYEHPYTNPVWLLYDPENELPPYLGDPTYKWHIGNPDKNDLDKR